MGARRAGLLTAAAIAMAAGFLPASANSGGTLTVKPHDCGEGRWCASLAVPEDWSKPDGRKLELKMIGIKARKPVPGAEPVFFMAGGPGQTSTDLVRVFMNGPESEHRDFILINERGTERGSGLHCPVADPDAFRTPYSAENARHCLAALKEKVDLTHYTTPNVIRDFDAARAALGFEKIHIQGGSGGTYTGLMYARMYPRRVRTMILISAVPPNILVPLYHAQNAQISLDRLFEECEADPACRSRYPELRSEYYALLAALDRSPQRVTLAGGEGAPDVGVTLTRDIVADATRVMMYRGGDDLPKLIAQGRAGQLEPFARTMLDANRRFYDIGNLGVELNIACAQSIPFVSDRMITDATAGTYLGDRRVAGQKAACKEWPRAPMPAGWFDPFTVDVPTLIISGRRDPVTPPRWGEEMRRWTPNSVHIVVPGGHAPFVPCTAEAISKLLSTASIKGLKADCSADERPWL